MFRAVVFCLVLTATVAAQGSAPGGTPFLTVYPPSAYDGAAQTWDVVEDDRGVVYIANISGVKQFDGARWRSITLPSRSNPRALAASGERVFVGAYGEFGALMPDSTATLGYVSFSDELPADSPAFADVLDIVATPETAVFLTRTALFAWRAGTGVRRWEPPGTLQRATHFGGRLVVGVEGGEIYEVDDGVFRPLPGTEALAGRRIRDLVQVGDQLLVATERGLLTYDGATLWPYAPAADGVLAPLRLFDVTPLPDGHLAVGTQLGGLIVLDARGRIVYTLDERSGLPSADVKAGTVGRDGNLWLALQDGVARVELRTPFRQLEIPMGMGEHVIALARQDSVLYAATNAGVVRVNDRGERAQAESVRGIQAMCQALLETESGLLAGCDAEVLLIRGRDVVQRVPMPSSTYALHRSRRDPSEVWVGLHDGLAVIGLDPRLRAIGRVPRVRGSVRTLVEDGPTLWVGTDYNGVLRVGLPLGEDLQPRVAERMPQWDQARVNVFEVDGAPLFSSDAPGLGRYAGRAVPFAPAVPLDTVLAGERANLFRLAVGPNGDLWVRAGGVETRLRKRGEAYRWEEAPLQRIPSESTYAILPETSGAVWYGGTYGLLRYDGSGLDTARPLAPALVRSVSAIGSDVTWYGGAPGAPFTSELPYGQNGIRFAYAAPLYTRSEEVRYQIRLDGLDDAWLSWTDETQKDYTNLSPGAYRFRVRARDLYGQMTEEGTYAFRIIAPWYRTGWALGAIALLGVGLIAGMGWQIGRVRTRHLRARQDELEAEVLERTEALAQEYRRAELARLDAERARVEAEASAETIEAQHRELTRLNADKSRLFANVSHEFRTPLTLIVGPLEDLRDGLYGPIKAVVREPVTVALGNARRLLRLVEQLLDVAKLEARQVRLSKAVGDLVAFVGELVDSFRSLSERRHIELTYDLPSNPVNVAFDPHQLDKVVANLLSNAFKHTPDGGAVRVILTADGDEATLAVVDTGPGIAPEHLGHVFDRFYQAEGERVVLQPGTGIGLAIVREITELHGGTVRVKSEVGTGSRFTVSLPLAAGAEHATTVAPTLPSWEGWDLGNGRAPAPEPPPTEEDTTTVLVVDDHADIRAYVSRHLGAARAGRPPYRLIEAADGAEGLARARAFLPDLVISDVMMPELDGVGLCRALKETPETDFIPVILLTAKAGEEATLDGLGVGADDYVRKPFNVRELAARVDNLIDGRRRLRERFAAADTASPLPSLDPSLDPEVAVFVRSVHDAIETHLADESFGVEALSAAVGVSRSVLYRRLKGAGATPQSLLRKARLARAARLLEEQAGTVSEVAYAVGFKSVAHFSRAFRDAFGEPPSAVNAASGRRG